MRVYKLTSDGRDIVNRVSSNDEEMRVLRYIANSDGKRATDEELDRVAERWVVRVLKRRKLIREVGEI